MVALLAWFVRQLARVCSLRLVLEQNFYNIWLKGPANLVFKGTITINE